MKKFAKDVKIGDVIIYNANQSPVVQPIERYGYQAEVLEVKDKGLYFEFRIVGGWLTPFQCNDIVELQQSRHTDMYQLQNRTSARKTVAVGNMRVGIE